MYLQRWHGWCHMKLLPSFGCFQGLRWQITVSTKLLSFGKWCIKTSLELLCFAAHLAVFCHIGVKSRGWYTTYSASNFLHVVSRFYFIFLFFLFYFYFIYFLFIFYWFFSILSAKVHTHKWKSSKMSIRRNGSEWVAKKQKQKKQKRVA